MRDFKREITLNEEDMLNDMLMHEKALVKLYATAITESVSNGARTIISNNLKESIDDQISVFFLLTELDYEKVEAAKEEQRICARANFAMAKQNIER